MHEGRVQVLLADGRELLVDRIVMCTGARGPRGTRWAAHHDHPRTGSAQAGVDAGFLVDPDTGALIDERSSGRRALRRGPLRRGVLWESAIPEIRVQAVELARELLQRQPVTA